MKNYFIKICILLTWVVLGSCSSKDDRTETTDVSVNYTVQIVTDDRMSDGELILNPSLGLDNLETTSAVVHPGQPVTFTVQATVPEAYAGFLRVEWYDLGGPYTIDNPYTVYTLNVKVVRNDDVTTAQEVDFIVGGADNFTQTVFQF